ncbi:hypothetical protein BJV74DRAFT_797219 [Russula compacta]|nr:hypothetical protein BJV74DRAFT_797219 [Russula compacta]
MAVTRRALSDLNHTYIQFCVQTGALLAWTLRSDRQVKKKVRRQPVRPYTGRRTVHGTYGILTVGIMRMHTANSESTVREARCKRRLPVLQPEGTSGLSSFNRRRDSSSIVGMGMGRGGALLPLNLELNFEFHTRSEDWDVFHVLRKGVGWPCYHREVVGTNTDG